MTFCVAGSRTGRLLFVFLVGIADQADLNRRRAQAQNQRPSQTRRSGPHPPRARLRIALTSIAPFAALVALAALLVSRPILAAGIGSGVISLGVLASWRGRALQNAFVVGLLSGAVPLVLVAVSMRVNYLGSVTACASVCVTAAAVGGLAAGCILASWQRRSAQPGRNVGLAAIVSFGTAAMACGCLGFVELTGTFRYAGRWVRRLQGDAAVIAARRSWFSGILPSDGFRATPPSSDR